MGCVMEMRLEEGQRVPSGAVDESVSQAGGKQLYHHMSLLSQGATLTDSP